MAFFSLNNNSTTDQRIRTMSKSTIKIHVRELKDIYQDNWLHIIDEELRLQFTKKTWENLYWLKTRELNILKRVVNETSLVYKNGATRELVSEDQEAELNEQQNDLYNDIITKAKKDTVMDVNNKYVNLSNNTLVKVVYRNNQLEYDIITFDNCELYTSPTDWKKIIAIKYYVGIDLPIDYTSSETPTKVGDTDTYTVESDAVTRYQRAFIWTADDIKTEDYKGLIENDQIPVLKAGIAYELKVINNTEHIVNEEVNPYKNDDGTVLLPFILYQKEYPIDHLLNFTSGADTLDLTINVAVNMAHINQLIKLQSYKQLAIITGDARKVPNPLIVDPARALVLESDAETATSAQVLDFQAQINELFQTVKERIVMSISTYGISPENFTLSGSPQSGIALKISNIAKLEYRQAQIPIYRDKEKELFNAEKIVWNYHQPTNKIDNSLIFRVDFGELDFPVSDVERSQAYVIKIANDVLTPIDWIMDDNPDITREQAEDIYIRNKGFNSTTSTNVLLQPPAQPTNAEPEVEEEVIEEEV